MAKRGLVGRRPKQRAGEPDALPHEAEQQVDVVGLRPPGVPRELLGDGDGTHEACGEEALAQAVAR